MSASPAGRPAPADPPSAAGTAAGGPPPSTRRQLLLGLGWGLHLIGAKDLAIPKEEEHPEAEHVPIVALPIRTA